MRRITNDTAKHFKSSKNTNYTFVTDGKFAVYYKFAQLCSCCVANNCAVVKIQSAENESSKRIGEIKKSAGYIRSRM